MNGVFNILKPPGMTSHDVVSFIRRLTGIRRVGHTGTLDPGAAGVLPVCVGLATRLADYITAQKKTYRAELTLGIVTDTGDAFGKPIAACATSVKSSDIEGVLADFTGEITQVPPMTSAIKIGGKKLYELARQGIEIERPSRTVVIYSLNVVKWDLETHPQRILLDIDCGKGTYIRSLAADIGKALGCGAFMSFLIRTAAGGFSLDEAQTLEALQSFAGINDLASQIITMERALGTDIPLCSLNSLQAQAIAKGQTVTVDGEIGNCAGIAQLHFAQQLLAIAQVNRGLRQGTCIVKPIKVFHSR